MFGTLTSDLNVVTRSSMFVVSVRIICVKVSDEEDFTDSSEDSDGTKLVRANMVFVPSPNLPCIADACYSPNMSLSE